MLPFEEAAVCLVAGLFGLIVVVPVLLVRKMQDAVYGWRVIEDKVTGLEEVISMGMLGPVSSNRDDKELALKVELFVTLCRIPVEQITREDTERLNELGDELEAVLDRGATWCKPLLALLLDKLEQAKVAGSGDG